MTVRAGIETRPTTRDCFGDGHPRNDTRGVEGDREILAGSVTRHPPAPLSVFSPELAREYGHSGLIYWSLDHRPEGSFLPPIFVENGGIEGGEGGEVNNQKTAAISTAVSSR